MSMQDPIANLLTTIRNAVKVKKEMSKVYYSKINKEILQKLYQEKYILGYKVQQVKDKKFQEILIYFAYYGKNESVITGLKRISSPSRRIYANVDNIPRVFNGIGIVILSTSKGILTDKEARSQRVGGEVISYV